MTAATAGDEIDDASAALEVDENNESDANRSGGCAACEDEFGAKA